MIDAGKCDWKTDVLPKKDSVLDLIRVAFYANQVSEAVDMIKDAFEKGYEVSANLMAVSTVKEQEIDQVLEEIAKTPATCVCVVDSFGSMYAEQIEILVKKYLRYGADTRRKSASTPTTISSWPSPTRSRPSSTGPTAWTPRWPAWAAAPAIAPWS